MAHASAEKLKQTWPTEKERVPPQRNSWHVRQSRLCQKEKSHQCKSPNFEKGESKGERERTLA